MRSSVLIRYVLLLVFCISTLFCRAEPEHSQTVIEIHARRFAYSPSEITLKKGQIYLLHLTSDDVPHSLRITALDFKADMKPHEFNDVPFTPAQSGDFTADCGVYCGAGHKTMSLTIHVAN
jgi:cytochrome c oxidase subunit 2